MDLDQVDIGDKVLQMDLNAGSEANKVYKITFKCYNFVGICHLGFVNKFDFVEIVFNVLYFVIYICMYVCIDAHHKSVRLWMVVCHERQINSF